MWREVLRYTVTHYRGTDIIPDFKVHRHCPLVLVENCIRELQQMKKLKDEGVDCVMSRGLN
jgi:hypothetical protein